MSSINQKLGLKPAGKRAMMKLPADRALRNRITSARCPACDRTGARLTVARNLPPNTLVCTWCTHTWELSAE
jgi:hypothetical protein